MSISKKCTVCDKEFTTKNDKGIYCSNSCRVKAYRKRKKEDKTELEKNISEEYAAELSFFRTKVNHLFEELEKLKSEMVTVTKYMMVFAEKIGQIPQIEDTSDLEGKIADISERLEEKIEKDEDNNRLIGFKISEFADAINRINDRIDNSASKNPGENVIDKILDSEKIPELIDMFANRKKKTAEKTNETS